MQAIKREIITKYLADFENRYDVISYRIDGVPIWPIVRCVLALSLFGGKFETAVTNSTRIKKNKKLFKKKHKFFFKNLIIKLIIKVSLFALKLRIFCKHIFLERPRVVPTGDILFVTYKTCKISFGNNEYDTIVDPIVNILEKQKIDTVVWEDQRNKKNSNEFYPSWNDIAKKLKSNKILSPKSNFSIEPNWFNEISTDVYIHFNVEFEWKVVEKILRRVLIFSQVARQWLKRTKCRVVCTVGWYNFPSMAFLYAASSLGLVTVDLQHGIQGTGHFAYHAWSKVPRNGYDFLPQKFWVWGEADAKNLIQGGIQNCNEDDILIGGNLWINKWKKGDDNVIADYYRELSDFALDYERIILVTLQKDVDTYSFLASVIEKSPHTWCWLVRVHRNDEDKFSFFYNYFEKIAHEGINLSIANNYPLFSLFQISDIHVTGFSTCAFEALAFGVPTILVHISGKYAFKEQIEMGVMRYTENKNQVLAYLSSGTICNAGKKKMADYGFFAPEECGDIAVKQLIN